MPSAAFQDNPWRRLAWALPSAGMLTAVALAVFLRLLAGEPPRALAPSPLHVQLVELPAASAPTSPAEPAPSEPTPAVTVPSEPAVEAPPAESTPTEAKPSPVPMPSRLPQRPAARRAAKPAPVPPVGPVITPPLPESANASSGGNSIGARAIVKPMPEIPESLRRRDLDLAAVARFRVASDGTAQVELIGPTPNPQLNRILLEALGRWRFFPAMENGKPVASTIDIRIPISVR